MSLEFLLKSRKMYVTAESKLSDSYGHVSYQERDILEDTTSELFDLEISLRIN